MSILCISYSEWSVTRRCFTTIAVQLCFRICNFEDPRKSRDILLEWNTSATFSVLINLLDKNMNTVYSWVSSLLKEKGHTNNWKTQLIRGTLQKFRKVHIVSNLFNPVAVTFYQSWTSVHYLNSVSFAFSLHEEIISFRCIIPLHSLGY